MNRDAKAEPEHQLEPDGSGENSGAREHSAWSRREFLTSSAGLAAAGAIGGLAANLPLSANDGKARAAPTPVPAIHPRARPRPASLGASSLIRIPGLTTPWPFFWRCVRRS